MTTRRAQGFTLIELLTVIAIIAILAGMTLPALSRARERSRVASVVTTFRHINQAMTAYLGSSARSTYPGIYGYRVWETRDETNPLQAVQSDPDKTLGQYFQLTPYMALIEMHDDQEQYDLFSQGYNTNPRSPAPFDTPGLTILEWGPVGLRDPVTQQWSFSQGLYRGAETPGAVPGSLPSELRNEYDRALNAQRRPFVYIPVNRDQARRVNAYYQEILRDTSRSVDDRLDAAFARIWDPEHPRLQGMTFPPPRYDAYVLISVGPTLDTAGVVCSSVLLNNLPPEYRDRTWLYHITALRAFWLATRDLNEDGLPDFDFENRRSRGGGGDPDSYRGKVPEDMLVDATGAPLISRLPDTTNGYGPIIHVVQ